MVFQRERLFIVFFVPIHQTYHAISIKTTPFGNQHGKSSKKEKAGRLFSAYCYSILCDIEDLLHKFTTLTVQQKPYSNTVEHNMKWMQFFTPVSSITWDEADKLVADNPPGDVLFLDVRQPKEYEGGHLPGAKLLPLGDLDSHLTELDKEKPIVIY
jgi:hypothetical protein